MNEDLIRECKETFDLYDTEENGYLDIKQTKELSGSFGIIASDEEINALATNSNNGKVSYDTFLSFYSEKMQNAQNDNLDESFNILLSKKTRTIKADKFKSLLMNYGQHFTEQEANEILQEFKVDENGNLNYKDFLKAMHSQ